MLKNKLLIQNDLGLHARAAMELIKVADRFQSEIQIDYQSQIIDGKDMLALMALGAAKGAELLLSIDGPDEEEAMCALSTLIDNRFGEPS